MIAIEFAPKGLGPFADTITLKYVNGAVSATATRDVFGTGGAPASLIISDGPVYNYGTHATGSLNNKTFAVTNDGWVTATGLSGSGLKEPFTFLGGSYPGTGGTCGLTLSAMTSCTIVVEYAPTKVGLQSDTIELNYNNGAKSSTTTLDLQGTGAGVAPATVTDL
jgi:hypothetical protein